MVDVDLPPRTDLSEGESPARSGRHVHVQDRKSGLRARIIAALPYLLVLAASLFFLMAADRIEFDRVEGRIGPDAWPKLIIILMIAASAWGSIRAAFGGDASAALPAGPVEPTDELEAVDDHEIYPRRVWGALAGTVAYLVLLSVLGFFVSSALFIALIVYLGGYRKLGPLFAIAIIGSLFFMVIFVRVVYVSLPLGMEPFAAISLALLKMINM